MRKLYEKSQIWFAMVWIGVYVIGVSIADGLSGEIGVEKSITLPFLAVLSAAAMAFIRKYGLQKEYGLCRPNAPAAKFLYYLPLAVVASCNAWFGLRINLPPAETALYVASMLCVGFLEELIFRGFLFKAMCRDGLRSAIIVSSITFGIGHIINLINGSGADLVSNLCQVGYAIAFGFLFVIIFHRSGSILPCIAAHSAINALSAFANREAMTPTLQLLTSAILAAIAVAYTLVLLRTLPKSE